MTPNKIYNIDCMEGFKMLDNKSVDMVLTDIPYGECNGRKCDLREINKGDADTILFQLEDFVKELLRVCKGTFYIFCGIKQISKLTELLQRGG